MYPPFYKHTDRSYESIQMTMPLLCYKLPSKCHGSQKNIKTWFWGRRHVGGGPCTLCLCCPLLYVCECHFICIRCILPASLGSGSFLSLRCPSQDFPSLCKVSYFLDRKLVEGLLLLSVVWSPFPVGGAGVRRCGGKDTDFKRFQCKKLFIVKGLGVLWG